MTRTTRCALLAIVAALLCAGPAVAAPAGRAFQHEFRFDFAEGEDIQTGTYTVPAGRRLVVEYASLAAFLPPDGQTITVRVVTTTADGDAFHVLSVQNRGEYGVLKQFEGAHTVRFYAGPGTVVRVSMGRLPAAGTANGFVTLSGRLEILP